MDQHVSNAEKAHVGPGQKAQLGKEMELESRARMRSCGALGAMGSFGPHSKSKVKPQRFLSKPSVAVKRIELSRAGRGEFRQVWQDWLVCTKVAALEMARAEWSP